MASGRRSIARGWDVMMKNARQQAESYVFLLDAHHPAPPFIIVCDVGHCLELYADFTGTGRAYSHFPDRNDYRIYLDDLRDEATRTLLKRVWLEPHALDPSRCPPGKAILWLQLPEAPRHIKGDAAGKLAAPADGQWTEELREAYADRAEEILAAHIDGFKSTVLGRRAYSPADLEAMNVNLVGGDPYGGSSAIDQAFLWRPFKSSRNHETSIGGLYHIGASTHPGAGLGGGSGFLLAQRL